MPAFSCVRSLRATIIIGVAAALPVAGQSLFPPPVPYRNSIVAPIRDLWKISTPEGIDTLQRPARPSSDAQRAPVLYHSKP